VSKSVFMHGHYSLAKNIQMGVIDEDKLDQYFKFAMVRNPWDRIVSRYFYSMELDIEIERVMKNEKSTDAVKAERVAELKLTANTFKETGSFKEFISQLALGSVGKYRRNHILFRDQSWWLDDRLDFIGRFENYNEDVKFICDTLDIPFKDVHLNKSTHDHYSAYYDQETIDLVADIYKKDIEVLGYDYEDRI
jgi:chondroitin 4-sulfotransferase 11